ncbi:hypothetical protein WP50_11755 [Lactiplantibacillus plantarum]|nr:hypothetical protein WP50_11755 [Lactiplantibacillus plantarum]
MIITSRPKTVIDSVQNRIRRGVTIVHNAEGAYQHDDKTILFTVITRYEMGELKAVIAECDADDLVSIRVTRQKLHMSLRARP